jgi:agmatinase
MHEPEDASVAIIGIPFDGTVSNRPGARFGPEAVRSATLGAEDYSPYLDRDIATVSIHDAGDLELPIGDTAAVLRVIGENYRTLTAAGPRVVALGGEHLVSLPLIEATHERYGDDLFVVQLDAHTDLRHDYLGVALSHAAVMHHVKARLGADHMAQIGIRSGAVDEWRELRAHPYFFGSLAPRPLESFPAFARETLAGRPIYLTIDLDVFDPGILPGTGTPEPGGISFREAMALLKSLIDARADIIGADIVELAPDYDHSGISAALAATLLRELILMMGKP